MDPIANIKRQRELADEIHGHEAPLAAYGDELVEIARLGAMLAEQVVALDDWRKSGGFDPYRPA